MSPGIGSCILFEMQMPVDHQMIWHPVEPELSGEEADRLMYQTIIQHDGGSTLLKKLDCGNNKLKKLSISKNRKLTVVECHIDKLTKLNITKNTKLKKLKCFRNDIHILNAKKQKAANAWSSPASRKTSRCTRNSDTACWECPTPSTAAPSGTTWISSCEIRLEIFDIFGLYKVAGVVLY